MAKKRILIFAHYYAPDAASTGQILKDQAEGMLGEFDVTVICVVPSYDGKVVPEYKTQKYYFEELNGVRIIRVNVPEFTKGNKKSRIINIVTYFWRALGATKKAGNQDCVFAISQPPILGGLLGVMGKWLKHAKLIYCIQDFNPEQVMAINYSRNRFVINLMMLADKFSCRRSDLVITVGRDLIETLECRFKGKKVPKHVMINNWIDEKAVYPLPENNERVMEFKKKYGLLDKYVIMYSGNIGLYYDLENLIKVLKKFRKGYTTNGVYEKGPVTADGKEVVFAFVGEGAMLDNLKSYAQRHCFENIIFIPYQKKEDLIYSLNAGDAHWCVNAKRIKGVSCPSKVYGIMATGKPILGVLEKGSEGRLLIEECGCGLCSDPGAYDEIYNMINYFLKDLSKEDQIKMGSNGRVFLQQNFTKNISINKYINEFNELMNK